MITSLIADYRGKKRMEIKRENITYRRATSIDFDALIDCRMRFLDEPLRPQNKEEKEKMRKSLERYFSETLPTKNLIAWLAEHEGRIVGTGYLVVWRILGRYRGLETGELGYILNMYTVPEARRNGIGTRLLQELIREAKSRGLKHLHLHASKEGMSIYRKAGFTEPLMPELVLRI
jgi:GNAT superfamily N-acetyltransferase